VSSFLTGINKRQTIILEVQEEGIITEGAVVGIVQPQKQDSQLIHDQFSLRERNVINLLVDQESGIFYTVV
jgi:hypothetical protein